MWNLVTEFVLWPGSWFAPPIHSFSHAVLSLRWSSPRFQCDYILFLSRRVTIVKCQVPTRPDMVISDYYVLSKKLAPEAKETTEVQNETQ